MIKSRRKSAHPSNRRPVARKPNTVDKNAGRQRASRTAKINARRGIQQDGKPSAMEIEREVYRQTRMNNTPTAKGAKRGPRSRKESAAQVKARKLSRNEKKKKAQKQGTAAAPPPTWIAGTKRPPSKKAVNAAVNAMQGAGFKVPQGMQMVISFAPAPNNKPPANQKKGGHKGGQQNKSQNRGNANKGKQNNAGGGGGRKK